MERDILGLGGPDATVKNLESADTTDATTNADDAERRRRRMSEGADELTPGPTGVSGGAGGGTGIDMGPGGERADME